MAASDLPALSGMPQGCKDFPPWTGAPVAVVEPYQSENDGIAYLKPLISLDWPTSRFEMFGSEEAYKVDRPGRSIGYDTPDEGAVWAGLKQGSGYTRDRANHLPEMHPKIVEHATASQDAMLEIHQIYEKYREGGSITYPVSERGSGTSERVFPLSVVDSDLVGMVKHPNPTVLAILRAKDRAEIRDLYHEAVHQLWCARYLEAMSDSYQENQRLYESRTRPEGAFAGPGVQPGWLGDAGIAQGGPSPVADAGIAQGTQTPDEPTSVAENDPTSVGDYAGGETAEAEKSTLGLIFGVGLLAVGAGFLLTRR